MFLYRNGIIRCKLDDDDQMDPEGWLHPCMVCSQISSQEIIIKKSILRSADTIITRDGIVPEYDGFVFNSCTDCNRTIGRIKSDVLYTKLLPRHKYVIDILEDRMRHKLKSESMDLIQYE